MIKIVGLRALAVGVVGSFLPMGLGLLTCPKLHGTEDVAQIVGMVVAGCLVS